MRVLLIGAVVLLTGCGTLVPKKVEFGQDRVQKFPEAKRAETETQRQAARMTAERANETLQQALVAEAPEAVLKPATDTAILADAVSESVGPPKNPAPVDAEARQMAADLRTAMAKLALRVQAFKEESNENVGKKIEGTGFLQIPYFVYLLILGAMVFVGLVVGGILWTIFKMYAASNPPVQLGMNAVQLGAGFLKRALKETVEGGEKFKDAVLKHVNDPVLQSKVKEVFRVEQERAQSRDTQEVVKAMTAKE